MVDLARILSSPDISTLRDAVADAFTELSLEEANAVKISDLDVRIKTLEEKP